VILFSPHNYYLYNCVAFLRGKGEVYFEKLAVCIYCFFRGLLLWSLIDVCKARISGGVYADAGDWRPILFWYGAHMAFGVVHKKEKTFVAASREDFGIRDSFWLYRTALLSVAANPACIPCHHFFIPVRLGWRNL
jgi:hypothetical protein